MRKLIKEHAIKQLRK